MVRSLARFSRSDASCRTPWLAGCITNTSGSRFSARTAVTEANRTTLFVQGAQFLPSPCPRFIAEGWSRLFVALVGRLVQMPCRRETIWLFWVASTFRSQSQRPSLSPYGSCGNAMVYDELWPGRIAIPLICFLALQTFTRATFTRAT
jgi:hypothetical protein